MKRIYKTYGWLLMMLLVSLSMSGQRLIQSTVELKLHDGKGNKVYTYQRSKVAYLSVKMGADKARFQVGNELSVLIKSETEQEAETIVLKLKSGTEDEFWGEIPLSEKEIAVKGNGLLEVKAGDRITFSYKLPDLRGSGHDTLDDEAWYRGPNWSFFNTGQNHVILIPQWAEISIKGEPIQPGDFISVFYEKKEGDKVELHNAGGMGYATAPGGVKYTGQNVAIAVWGTQENKSNGMALGEAFKWRIWRASENKYYDATPEYMPVDEKMHISHSGTYALDGISGVNKLIVK